MTQNTKHKTQNPEFLKASWLSVGRAFRTVCVSRVSRAFTLVEMLVVTAIIIVVSSVVLVNSGRLGGQFILDNFAYDLALTVRQAQVYGISVRNFGGNFNVAYGIHFDSSTPTTYLLYGDVGTPNGLYDTGELVQSFTITRGFKIASICVTPNALTPENCTISKLDVLFKRPEPDALISAENLSCLLVPTSCQESTRIVLVAPRGNTKSVVIAANGQISVR